MLVDAPCSGTGVLSKRADLRWRRTPADFGELVRLQVRQRRPAPAPQPAGGEPTPCSKGQGPGRGPGVQHSAAPAHECAGGDSRRAAQARSLQKAPWLELAGGAVLCHSGALCSNQAQRQPHASRSAGVRPRSHAGAATPSRTVVAQAEPPQPVLWWRRRSHPDPRCGGAGSATQILTAVAQAELLDAAAALVRPGGVLVYSTCSLEAEENEGQVAAFLARAAGFALQPAPPGLLPPGVLTPQGCLATLPHRHGTDGAFAARLLRAP